MEEITFFCTQKLMDDMLDSSSSSDEDNELFEILSIATLQQQWEKLTENTVSVAVTAKNYKLQNLENKVIKSVSESGVHKTKCSYQSRNFRRIEEDNEIVPVLAKNNDQNDKIRFENSVQNPISEYNVCQENAEVCIEDKEAKSNEQSEQNPFENDVINSLSEVHFKRSFHISRETANFLMEKYSLWDCKSSLQENSKKTIVERSILSFLWFCAHAISFADLEKQLNTSSLILNQSFNNILKFFTGELASEIIKLPSSYIEKEAVAKGFEKVAGFPNVLGCIAESYFPVKSQKLVQKLSSQVYLRGICDSNRRFLHTKIGFPKEITSDSFIENDLPKLCFPKYHFLGDSKCPIRGYLMTPFDNTENLSDSEKYFNIKLYRTHVKIKNAFGMLRSRFQQLKYLDFNDVETMTKFIFSCCVLHNICIDREDFYTDEIYTDVSDRLYRSSFTSIQNDEFLTELGIMKRSELKQILFKAKN